MSEELSFYEQVGGWEMIHSLVDDFYHIMRTDQAAKECFATHSGKDISESAMKLKYFLSGWLGGPQLYLEKFGHPRLRMRHFPFAISEREADQWMYCMRRALERSELPASLQDGLLNAFSAVTIQVKNR